MSAAVTEQIEIVRGMRLARVVSAAADFESVARADEAERRPDAGGLLRYRLHVLADFIAARERRIERAESGAQLERISQLCEVLVVDVDEQGCAPRGRKSASRTGACRPSSPRCARRKGSSW